MYEPRRGVAWMRHYGQQGERECEQVTALDKCSGCGPHHACSPLNKNSAFPRLSSAAVCNTLVASDALRHTHVCTDLKSLARGRGGRSTSGADDQPPGVACQCQSWAESLAPDMKVFWDGFLPLAVVAALTTLTRFILYTPVSC